MSSEYFEIDHEQGVIRFKNKHSASLLLAILTAGKFGEYLDPKVLLNPHAAHLMDRLGEANPLHTHRDPSIPFAKEFLFAIGRTIASNGNHIGWWKMSHDEQRAYIESVVAKPHSFTGNEIDDIFEAIESEVILATELANAAKAVKD